MQKIEIRTRDGVCPAYVYTPAGAGPWPAALLYIDGPGMRPAVHEMAERLASHGYLVLMPDIFYRSGAYPPIDPKVVFGDPELRKNHFEKIMGPATSERVMSDTSAFLETLAARPDVQPGPVGVVGYCMGGRLALLAAGTFPERISVAAAYHAGGLASDAPDSPHLLAARVKAKVYVGAATEDSGFDDAARARLEEALTSAGVDYEIETYPAKHGWVPRDMPVYDEAEAEHHWRTLVPLFDGVLKG